MSPEYPFDYAVVFMLGLLFGSFANVCIYRLPQRLSIIFPGSHCPSCQEALRPWHNIPLLSYLLLGGQCSRCKTTISLRYPLIELSNGLLYIFVPSIPSIDANSCVCTPRHGFADRLLH